MVCRYFLSVCSLSCLHNRIFHREKFENFMFNFSIFLLRLIHSLNRIFQRTFVGFLLSPIYRISFYEFSLVSAFEFKSKNFCLVPDRSEKRLKNTLGLVGFNTCSTPGFLIYREQNISPVLKFIPPNPCQSCLCPHLWNL